MGKNKDKRCAASERTIPANSTALDIIINTLGNRIPNAKKIGVWFGYGIIDILFKQVAKSGGGFPTTLFIAFTLAACIMFIYLLFKRTQWNVASFVGGMILGVLNFFNILFYIKAHQSFGSNPTLVFAGMNIGVICLGTVIGALIFKEKISKINGVGIVFSLTAIFCLYYLDKILA